jgi:hypothetical protein
MNPYNYEFSDIDVTQTRTGFDKSNDYFTLFDFSLAAQIISDSLPVIDYTAADKRYIIEDITVSGVPDYDNQVIIGIIQQITADLAKYYPDLEQLGTTIAPLSGMVATINTARESKAKIEEMRANLLK